jgi:hypothetical protein
MTNTGRVVASVFLGFGYFIALAIPDEMLTSPGHRQTPPAAWIIAASYLALAQFIVARKGLGFRATRSTLVGMVTPVALMYFLSLAAENNANVARQAPWWFLACVGALIGAVAAGACRWLARKKTVDGSTAFFVVGDQMGVHIYEYASAAEVHLNPGEVLVSRADTLEEAQRIQAETDPRSARPSAEG